MLLLEPSSFVGDVISIVLGFVCSRNYWMDFNTVSPRRKVNCCSTISVQTGRRCRKVSGLRNMRSGGILLSFRLRFGIL